MSKIQSQIEEARWQLAKAEKDVEYQRSKINELEVQKSLMDLKLKNEIQDWQAPRCGEPWNDLEKKILQDEVDGLTFNYASKFGRSSIAIRFRIIKICMDQIPRVDVMAKIAAMIKTS